LNAPFRTLRAGPRFRRESIDAGGFPGRRAMFGRQVHYNRQARVINDPLALEEIPSRVLEKYSQFKQN
jgi:hypothetical protein